MTASLIVVALGAVVAAVGTGALTARCAKTPRMFLIAWTVVIFGLAVSLGAQALGYLAGYSDPIFRAMEIGAQAVAPLGLCLGLVELIGRSVPARFVMRLAVAAISVIMLAILGTDPLSTSTALSTSWPDPTVFYQLIPVGLIEFLALFTIATALGSGLTVLIRSGRGPEFESVVGPALIAGAGAGVVALPGVMMLGHMTLHSKVFALTSVLAAVATWLAASAAAKRGLAADRLGHDAKRQPRPAGRGRYESDDRPMNRHDSRGPADEYLASAHRDHRDRRDFRDEGGYPARSLDAAALPTSDPDADVRYPALAALAAERSDSPGRLEGAQPGSGQYDSGEYDSGQYDSGQYDSGEYDSGRYDSPRPDAGPYEPDPPPGAREPYGERSLSDSRRVEAADPPPNLFGQITIYTLIDDRLEDFDRMTEHVVEQARSREPGTLVYIVHAVPTAPMQRILYEVYRDREAYEEHLAQPYVVRYVTERRPMVLATNTIELGLQLAKISPLPSYSAISDILSESGIDLTGVTRSSRAAADRARQHGGPEPRELPGSGTERYEPAGQDDDLGYDGWSGLRDEDRWYR